MHLDAYWCNRCKRKYGTNPLYVHPSEDTEKSRRIDLLSREESEVLHNEYMHQGCNSETAWKKVNNRKKYLRWFQSKKRYTPRQELKELNKKFIEGIKKLS